MSMLAEKKRKQKWSLNPRGKAWSQDNNKFGQKLLEKMGWSHGKGLGAKENGITEHIKVSYKNDSQGMGYKESDDQWTEHESNFTALLTALGGGGDHKEMKLSSLEEKSQNSKARVHYKKFTRGKDLSKYSEKDLANIFGKKSLNEKRITEIDKDVSVENIDSISKDKNFSNGGLMSDYFKRKNSIFGKKNGCVIGNNGVLKKEDESESEKKPSFGLGFNPDKHEHESENEIRPAFGFGFHQNEEIKQKELREEKPTFVSYINNSDVGGQQTPKKTKNKKKKRTFDDDSIEDTPSKKKKIDLQAESQNHSAKKKKDKSKKKHTDETGLSNPAFDPLYSPMKCDKHVLEPIREDLDDSLNAALNDTVGQVADSFEVQVQIDNEVTVEKGSKLRKEVCELKKKSKTMPSQSGNLDESSTLQDSSGNQISQTPKKKKKKTKVTGDDIEQMDISLNVNDIEEDFTDISNDNMNGQRTKKKKQKRNADSDSTTSSSNIEEDQNICKKEKTKSKRSQTGYDNPFFNMSIEESSLSQNENPYEVKPKEKKKKRNKTIKVEGVENPIFNDEDSINSQDIANEEFEIKRKDKSKKKKRKDLEEIKGLDNPALNLNDTIEESCDLILNVVATPTLANDKVDNPRSLGSVKKVKTVVERRKSVRFSDVTRERIIPSKEDIQNDTLDESREIVEIQGKLNDSDLSFMDNFIPKKKSKKNDKGLTNIAFDEQANTLEENITSIAQNLDSFQAEVENDMNEAKLKSVEFEDIMVGEVGNPEGSNEKLADGSIKLKFKHANFRKTAKYMDNLTGAKKSYKHLIKGDIVMQFKESNLHEIDGYAAARIS